MSPLTIGITVFAALAIGLLLCYNRYVIMQSRRMGAELKQLRETTQKTQSDLSQVMTAGDLMVWIHDVATDTIRFMKKDFTMTDPMPISEHFKLKHPNDKAVCEEAMVDLLNHTKDSINIHYHYVDSSVPGGYRTVECFVTAKWQDDKVVEMIGVEHDVTKTVQLLEELVLAKRKSQLAVEASGIISWELDVRTSEVTIINIYGKMAVRKLQLSACLQYVYEEDKKKVTETFYDLILNAREENFYLDLRLYIPGREGLQFCTMYGGALSHDGNQRPSSFIGYITNQTSYVEVNKKLEWANRYNRLILDNVNCGLLYVDADYNVLWDNIGHTFPGRNVFEGFCKRGKVGNCLMHAGRKIRCEDCLVEECLRKKEVLVRDYTLDDGLEVEIQLMPVWNDENVTGVVCRVDDITVRKQAMHELEVAREKAEASSRLKTTFLANMGHEIRTPLNAITGFASLLGEATPEKRDEYVQIIQTNSQSLTKMIDDLLELSNLECGELQLVREPLYLPALLESTLDFYRNHVTERVVLRTEYCGNLTILADANRIQEVLNHFMTNAIKYTESGSITLGYDDLGEEGVRIFVRDTGVGIPEENRARMFHRFEKFGSMVPGNGLGLSICKAIVDACGGKIGYDSRMGEGCTFWVVLSRT